MSKEKTRHKKRVVRSEQRRQKEQKSLLKLLTILFPPGIESVFLQDTQEKLTLTDKGRMFLKQNDLY